MSVLAASLWSRFLTYPMYQNALVAGVAIGVACALLSVFVVQKRMAFIGQGISHAAFGGVGLAVLLQLFLPVTRAPLVRDAIIALFCVGAALLIGRLTRGKRVTEDSAIGICLVATMAVGVLLVNLRRELYRRMSVAGTLPPDAPAYTPTFDTLLFGDILRIARADVWLACGVAAVVAVLVVLFFKELVFFACDEDAAEAFGVRTGPIYYGLLVCIGVTIVVAMKLLGVILCSALLILPGATAGLWSHRIGRLTVAAMLFSAACITAGLALAMTFGVLSPEPLIVLAMCATFGASWIVRTVRERGARHG